MALAQSWVGVYQSHWTCSSGYHRLSLSPFLCGDSAGPGKEIFTFNSYQSHFDISCYGGSWPHDYVVDLMMYAWHLRLRSWSDGRGNAFSRSEFAAFVVLLPPLLWWWIVFACHPPPFDYIIHSNCLFLIIVIVASLRWWNLLGGEVLFHPTLLFLFCPLLLQLVMAVLRLRFWPGGRCRARHGCGVDPEVDCTPLIHQLRRVAISPIFVL